MSSIINLKWGTYAYALVPHYVYMIAFFDPDVKHFQDENTENIVILSHIFPINTRPCFTHIGKFAIFYGLCYTLLAIPYS